MLPKVPETERPLKSSADPEPAPSAANSAAPDEPDAEPDAEDEAALALMVLELSGGIAGLGQAVDALDAVLDASQPS